MNFSLINQQWSFMLNLKSCIVFLTTVRPTSQALKINANAVNINQNVQANGKKPVLRSKQVQIGACLNKVIRKLEFKPLS